MRETANPIRNLIRPYFDNACMVREQRKELRSARTMWIWFAFLALLTLIAASSYAGTTGDGSKGLSQVQAELNSMYLVLINVLAFFLPTASIMGTATSLVQEKNSRSLEMVMTTPVDMRAYLLGRLMAAYRTILLYLVLALPFVSITVLIGGFTWWEVASAMILLSFHSLVLASMGLAIGATQTKEGTATFLSFLAVFAYQFITLYAALFLGGLAGGGSGGAQWLSAMNSFSSSSVSSQSSAILGMTLPNVVIVGFVSILLARLFLMSACSTLAPLGTKFTLHFRIHALLFALLLGGVNAVSASLVAGVGRGSFSGSTIGPSVGTGAFLSAAILCMIVAFLIVPISSHDRVSSIRNRLDGVFSWQGFRSGTPSGSLPFILLLFGCIYLPQLYNVRTTESFEAFLAFGIYGLGFILIAWALTAAYSIRCAFSIMARTYCYLTFAALAILPNFIIGILRTSGVIDESFDFTQIQIFRALIGYKPAELIITGLVCTGIAVAVAARAKAESRRLNAPPIQS